MASKDVKKTDAAPAAEAKKGSWEDQKVRVRLFKDTERYKDDVTVIHNGRAWKIKRGVDVEVPMYIALILQQSLTQDERTALMIQRESEGFEERQKNFDF